MRQASRAEPWVDGRRVGPVEVADTAWRRFRGLLGRTGLEGGLLLRPCSSVHTVGMRMTIDVALLSGDLRVLQVRTVRPHRFPAPKHGTRAVLETEGGVATAWGLQVGDRLELRPVGAGG